MKIDILYASLAYFAITQTVLIYLLSRKSSAPQKQNPAQPSEAPRVRRLVARVNSHGAVISAKEV